jgi:TetR/AcrR family transcriptional regulator, transcriptional repressor for nem operon
MKTSRETVEKNREALLNAASEGFRKSGFDGLKVADLMKSVGLTHGGFYGYFDSKEDLIEAACELTLRRQAERMEMVSRSDDPEAAGKALAAYFDRYLSEANRDTPESACLFPSLAADISRQSEPLKDVFTTGLKAYVQGIDRLSQKATKEAGQPAPMATMAMLVGAMVLSRAVSDPAFSNEILASARAELKQRHGLASGQD